jgi:dTDP-4-dehydrorhamnose 3,5-epimerase
LIFESTPIPGVRVVVPELLNDERGFFARTWCRQEFAAHGIPIDVVQASVSHNRKAGTLRGLHFSWPPSKEAKLVRCERGRIHDVVVDLRPESPAFTRHFAVVLDDETRNAIYIPAGVAHGFQTLVVDCEVLYMMTDFYRAELADGARFDDQAFGIDWPLPVTSIVERDRTYPDFDIAAHSERFAQALSTA